LTHSRIHSEALKTAGIKSVIINGPPADLVVPPGGLAVLESIGVTTMAAEA